MADAATTETTTEAATVEVATTAELSITDILKQTISTNNKLAEEIGITDSVLEEACAKSPKDTGKFLLEQALKEIDPGDLGNLIKDACQNIGVAL